MRLDSKRHSFPTRFSLSEYQPILVVPLSLFQNRNVVVARK
jgi:hypothetical protein